MIQSEQLLPDFVKKESPYADSMYQETSRRTKGRPGSPTEDANTLLSWHTNLLKIGRHKFIVLVNDKNRYAIVLYGLKAKEKKNIDGLIEKAIREVFRAESIKEEIIEIYLQASSDITFAKTKDRKLVSRLTLGTIGGISSKWNVSLMTTPSTILCVKTEQEVRLRKM
jgi:hypothetical protein